MVDTLVSGASASRRVGSTPIIRTPKDPVPDRVFFMKNSAIGLSFFCLCKELSLHL